MPCRRLGGAKESTTAWVFHPSKTGQNYSGSKVPPLSKCCLQLMWTRPAWQGPSSSNVFLDPELKTSLPQSEEKERDSGHESSLNIAIFDQTRPGQPVIRLSREFLTFTLLQGSFHVHVCCAHCMERVCVLCCTICVPLPSCIVLSVGFSALGLLDHSMSRCLFFPIKDTFLLFRSILLPCHNMGAKHKPENDESKAKAEEISRKARCEL